MRLIHKGADGSFNFITYDHEGELPSYAVLSHTWGAEGEELNYADIEHGLSEKAKSKPGYKKLLLLAEQAERAGIKFIWIDSCCINRSDSSDLSESINSMYRWYSNASLVYTHISDVNLKQDPQTLEASLRESRWFTRGWTLQELVAPKEVHFYDSEGRHIGTRSSLQDVIYDATGIDRNILTGKRSVHTSSIAERMSWAAGRQTKKAEDRAYSLFGIFDVNLPLIYGEGGERAFRRLQEEIMRKSTDGSLFAWTLPSRHAIHGLLAPSPDAFKDLGHIVPINTRSGTTPYCQTNCGTQITLPIAKTTRNGIFIATLNCMDQRTGSGLGIYLRKVGENQYVRTMLDRLPTVGMSALPGTFKPLGRQTIFVPQLPLTPFRPSHRFRPPAKRFKSSPTLKVARFPGDGYSKILLTLGRAGFQATLLNPQWPWRPPNG